jgi:hypothetical protein
MLSRSEFVRSNNELVLLTGEGSFLTCIFDGPDGFYYDPVGDEIFECRREDSNFLGPVYWIDFGDEQMTGNIKDHGLHFYMGKSK